jgi:trimethylamine--corrinoid protein Co-methyltransferase
MLPALAGANVIYGLGMLELGITFDFAQLVIDNEIAEMIKHVVRGIDVNDYTMAVDVIKEVGIGGEFVTNMHTFENFKKVQTDPKIFDRRMREGWEALGSKDVLERAREEAKNILENHKPDPLPAGTEKMLEDMVAEGEEELGLR